MSQYLEEAAALLRKAAAANEQENRGLSVSLMQGRERIAAQFAVLAAIEAGVLPAEVPGLDDLAERAGWDGFR